MSIELAKLFDPGLPPNSDQFYYPPAPRRVLNSEYLPTYHVVRGYGILGLGFRIVQRVKQVPVEDTLQEPNEQELRQLPVFYLRSRAKAVALQLTLAAARVRWLCEADIARFRTNNETGYPTTWSLHRRWIERWFAAEQE